MHAYAYIASCNDCSCVMRPCHLLRLPTHSQGRILKRACPLELYTVCKVRRATVLQMFHSVQDQHAAATSSLHEQADRMHREFEEYQAIKGQEIAALDERIRALIQGGATMPAAETNTIASASNSHTRPLRTSSSVHRQKGLRLVRAAGRMAKKCRARSRAVTPDRPSTASSDISAIKVCVACAASNCEVCLGTLTFSVLLQTVILHG